LCPGSIHCVSRVYPACIQRVSRGPRRLVVGRCGPRRFAAAWGMYQDVPSVCRSCIHGVSRVYPGCIHDVSRLFPCVSSVYPVCIQDVSSVYPVARSGSLRVAEARGGSQWLGACARMYPACAERVSRVYPGCIQGVSRVYARCIQCVARESPGYPQGVAVVYL
jgi:hypothetical protein